MVLPFCFGIIYKVMSESAKLPMNFGGISESKYSDFDTAAILVLPVSYEGTVSYGTGTGKGAAAIIDASRNLELYDEETDTEVYKLGIYTLSAFLPRDTPAAMMESLYLHSKNLVQPHKFLCLIGGEHSISAPIIQAYSEKFHNLSVLQIDAHADLRDEYDGTRHSHASVMARVVKDLRIPSAQVGIRSISADEMRALDGGLPTKVFWAKDIVRNTDWIERVVNSLTENVYLTIDVDGLDPSLMPTTGTPEPGGLDWYEVLELIKKVAEKKRIVGMDLVEFAPLENQNAPAFLCAKLIYKSLSYIFKGDAPRVIGKTF